MKSISELNLLREKMEIRMGIKPGEGNKTRVLVGLATCGIAAGAQPVFNEIVKTVEELGLKNIDVKSVGCIGLCQYEPLVEIVEPGKEKVTYVFMDGDKAKRIVKEHLGEGKPVDEFMLHIIKTKAKSKKK